MDFCLGGFWAEYIYIYIYILQSVAGKSCTELEECLRKRGPGLGPKAQGSWSKGVNCDLAMEAPQQASECGPISFLLLGGGSPPRAWGIRAWPGPRTHKNSVGFWTLAN